jgi:hypothetical protein
MPLVLVRDGVVRNGFLASLGTRTWRARAVGAAALADPAAVSSRGAYAAWLCRTARAWSRLPTPSPEGAPDWPLLSVGPECLDRQAALDADLADLCDLGRATGRSASDAAHTHLRVDEAFLVGAAYVAVVAATDAAALLDAAAALAAREQAPVGTRFLSGCRELARTRAPLRRELAAWAADRGPDVAERAVLTARALTGELAEALRR